MDMKSSILHFFLTGLVDLFNEECIFQKLTISMNMMFSLLCFLCFFKVYSNLKNFTIHYF